MNEFKKIVNEVFRTNISGKSRARKVVDGRKAYSKILRDAGYRFQEISKSLSLHHATIVHYVKTVDDLVKYDKEFKEKYYICKKKFIFENDEDILSLHGDYCYINSKIISDCIGKKIVNLNSKEEVYEVIFNLVDEVFKSSKKNLL